MKSYFTLNKSQKIGAVAVAVIIIAQILIFSRQNDLILPDPIVKDTKDFVFTDTTSDKEVKEKSNYKNNNKTITYYQFNPNDFNVENWVEFGFSEKQAKTIVNYKNKSKGFKYKQDLSKVFVISKEKYNELEPFIDLPNKKESDFQPKNEDNTKYEKEIIELNSASIEELKTINGVGDYTAKGIINYKKLLGGYHSKSQLKEVYGMTDENYEKIQSQIIINSNLVDKINVNQLSLPDLKKHPYIKWKTAEAIISERLKGKLSNLDFLVEKDILSESDLNTLTPYIEY